MSQHSLQVVSYNLHTLQKTMGISNHFWYDRF